MVRFVDRTFLLWAVRGLAAAFGLGVAIGGTREAGLTGLLWGGGVRMLVVHHVTYSINSLCHFFGRARYETADQSRNLRGSRCRRSASRGTTTTTPSPPRPRTGCAACRSTCRRS